MQLLMSTGNQHKLEEARNLLEALGFKIIGLSDLEDDFHDVVEDLETLEGNAMKKAREIWEIAQMPTFSDDTGLEVDALDGAPGVYSARYAGEEADANANRKKMLSAMKGASSRAAKFRTVIAFIDGKREYLFEGVCEGRITEIERGEKGFGYDKIFEPLELKKTFAEMSLVEKQEVSHRGKALKAFSEFLSTYGQLKCER